MSAPVQRCNHCGANLSLDDMRGTSCPYCRTVFPHHAQAAQHAALVNRVFNEQLRRQGIAPGGFESPHYGRRPGDPPLVNPMYSAAQRIQSEVAKTTRMVVWMTLAAVVVSLLIVAAVAVVLLL
jgi:hypothetical protein